MTFKGSAFEDVKKIQAAFPRQFTLAQICERLDWPKNRARQAIVMGVSDDYFRIIGEQNPDTRWVTYENVLWRKEWMTRSWGVSHEWRELAG